MKTREWKVSVDLSNAALVAAPPTFPQVEIVCTTLGLIAMPASKFIDKVRLRLLQAAAIGCSQETAAALAGIDQATLSRWLTKGAKEFTSCEDIDNLPAFAQFWCDWNEAQARPKERALAIVQREMDTNPMLAWKYVERRERGYQPPAPALPEKQQGPVIIQLTLGNGAPVGALEPQTVIDVEESHERSGPERTDPDSPDDADTPAAPVPLAGGSSE